MKLKAVQERRGVAAHSWKRGGQQSQRIEPGRTGELFRLGDAVDERRPGQNRLNRLIRIDCGLARGNQCRADAGIQTHLLVDRTPALLKLIGMGLLRLAVVLADEAVV